MRIEAAPRSCVVLFSGGTDSTCAAALCAGEFEEIHLLTFEERATRNSPVPVENARRLRARYTNVTFRHQLISTDNLVRALAYENYLKNLVRHGFFLLSTPGFSSLSWHLRTIAYCKRHGISQVRDGMTRELMHFPGHMPKVRELLSRLYAEHGIDFRSPVIDWDVPPDQRFTDRLIVDRHGFALAEEIQPKGRTTGSYLHAQGIFPHANVKGSLFDQRMQHDCYPFIVFNMFAFWTFLNWRSQAEFERRMTALCVDKISAAKAWLAAALAGAEGSDIFVSGLFEAERSLS